MVGNSDQDNLIHRGSSLVDFPPEILLHIRASLEHHSFHLTRLFSLDSVFSGPARSSYSRSSRPYSYAPHD